MTQHKIDNRSGETFGYDSKKPQTRQAALRNALKSLGAKFGRNEFVHTQRIAGTTIYCYRAKLVLGGATNILSKRFILWES